MSSGTSGSNLAALASQSSSTGADSQAVPSDPVSTSGASTAVLSPTSVLAFVDSFLQLLPESDAAEFQRLAEMRGYRRSELNCIMEAFRQRVAKLGGGAGGGGVAAGGNVPGSGGGAAAVAAGKGAAGVSATGEWSRIRKLEKLIKKRL